MTWPPLRKIFAVPIITRSRNNVPGHFLRKSLYEKLLITGATTNIFEAATAMPICSHIAFAFHLSLMGTSNINTQ